MKICYTAIIGEYDTLRDPLVIDPNWVYICFTTNRNITSNIWTIIYIDLNEFDPIRQARKIKIRPDFDQIDYTHYLWIDANIQVKTSLNKFVESLLNHDISLMNHPVRNNLEDEAIAIIELRKDYANVIAQQLSTYQSEGYPCNELAATGVIFRKNNNRVNEHASWWINEVNKHSYRDQMSFNYICWKLKIQPNYFSYDVIKNQNFIYHKHLKKVKV